VLVLWTVAVFATGLRAAPPGADELPAIKELPDPFLMNDGLRVKTKEDWQRRREELKKLILDYEYGHLDHITGIPKGTEISSKPSEILNATERQILLSLNRDGKEISVHLDLTIPAGKGPFPVIIVGDLNWGKAKPAIQAEVIKRGYVLAEFDRTEFAPDSKDQTTGVYAAFGNPDGGGALVAWAWGFHRVIDYLTTQGYIDQSHIAITGHSRGGKGVLLAGALDDRVALTCPNGSGCGGAGCYRFQAAKSEQIQDIVKNFPFWFQPQFNQFVGKVDRLPFDQHSIKALVAPRALFSTEALDDLWANPEGTQQSYLAAKEVYEFLGVSDKIGIHFRQGKHEHNLEDWTALLNFADAQFFNKKSDQKFDALAFPNSPKSFSWSAPKN
jgi:hypothetical protein